MSSILFGDTIVPIIARKIISSFGGILFYIRNIILLGSSTKTHYSCGVFVAFVWKRFTAYFVHEGMCRVPPFGLLLYSSSA